MIVKRQERGGGWVGGWVGYLYFSSLDVNEGGWVFYRRARPLGPIYHLPIDQDDAVVGVDGHPGKRRGAD